MTAEPSMTFGHALLPQGGKRRKSKKKQPPVSTICPQCLRFMSAHSMREKRACAAGVDDRDREDVL